MPEKTNAIGFKEGDKIVILNVNFPDCRSLIGETGTIQQIRSDNSTTLFGVKVNGIGSLVWLDKKDIRRI